jgi:hypothetical protein
MLKAPEAASTITLVTASPRTTIMGVLEFLEG